MSAITKVELDRKEGNYPYTWGEGFIEAVRQVRAHHPADLRSTMITIANIFGFKTFDQMQPWLRCEQADFTAVKGPHCLTVLKMLAIKHGRYHVKGE